MKRLLLIPLFLIPTTFFAMAAQDIGGQNQALNTKGTIGPPSCELNVNDGADVDFRKFTLSNLEANKSTPLGLFKAKLTVACDSGAYIRMQIVDSYMDTLTASVDTSLFPGTGIGKQFALVDASDSGVLLGSYQMTMQDVRTFDAREHFNLTSFNTGYLSDRVMTSSINDTTRTPDLIVFTDTNRAEQWVKNLIIEFDVEAQIRPKTVLGAHLNSAVDVQGESVFKMTYL